jgi:protein-S-isoprenylcysteine O-methyltransferase Ste14
MEAMVAVRRSGTSGLGWRVASYAGAAGFFALEAVARQPGEASDLAATPSDRGTTGLIVAAYGLAAGLSPMLRRLPVGRLPAVSGPAGVAMMAAGLSLRAWSMQALGRYYSRTLRTSSDQVVVESGPYRVIRHPGYLGSIMVWTGFGVASGSAAAALGTAALMSAAYTRRIAAEEDMLTGELGAAYTDYSRRTKRLIPCVW